MMRRLISVFVLTALVGVLSACESAKKIVGNQKNAPDEFTVYERPATGARLGTSARDHTD